MRMESTESFQSHTNQRSVVIAPPAPAILMASPSALGQPSGPDPGSVLCDDCRKSVLEPSQNTDNRPFRDRVRQVMSEWLLSSRMWPMGYIIGSPYSPFLVEKEHPNRDWRNAFEDLLALESGGDMISLESRKQEKAVAANFHWERASRCIEKLNRLNARDATGFALAQQALNLSKSPGNETDPSIVSWLENKLSGAKQMAQRRVALAEMFKEREANRSQFTASRHKDRGQWMASLITSGALRGWSSALEDSEDAEFICLNKESVASEDADGITFTERELSEHIEDGKPLEQWTPGPPLYQVPHQSPDVLADDHPSVEESVSPPPEEAIYVSRIPERPYFSRQTTTAERIALPNGKMATRVVMRNYLTDGSVEEKVIVQEPGKVLQEVEKAKALIQDRMIGFDQPI